MPDTDKGPAMPAWVRNGVMATVCVVWAAAVIPSVLRGVMPSAVVWAVPAATYSLLTGGISGIRRVKVEVDNDAPEKGGS